MADPRRLAVMGVTGSIGQQTLDVVRAQPGAFDIVAVSGGSNLATLADAINEFRVPVACVANPDDVPALAALVDANVTIVAGTTGLRELAGLAEIVVNAVVGFAGVPVTLATLAAGATLALANKESLISAAPLVALAQARGGGTIVPVDSEHCAIHQCLAGSTAPGHPDVAKLLLTASGGPFRTKTAHELAHVTRADALQHPTWSMGPKITVDSSTLMNKGLEVLEASALFGMSVDRIEVVVHPQSIVHSMVAYTDGSVVAQLSSPDMRLPIAYCLNWPERGDVAWGALDFTQAMQLEFFPPDLERFPALQLAYDAARRGGAAPTWLSAANEVAVAAFLEERISWRGIVDVVARTLDAYEDVALTNEDELYANDALARRIASDTLTL